MTETPTEFLQWLASLDDDDPNSPGRIDRQTVRLQDITDRARAALGTATPKAFRPRVLVDFDGVIHRYSKGWHDGTAYDEPMPGAREALEAIEAAGYEVVIFSTRNPDDIARWLHRNHFEQVGGPHRYITNEKLPAVAMIDDRAIRFTEWSEALADLLRLYPVMPR